MCALQALSQYLVNINVWAHNILTLCARAFCSKEVRFLPLCTAPVLPCSECDWAECRLHAAPAMPAVGLRPAASARRTTLGSTCSC